MTKKLSLGFGKTKPSVVYRFRDTWDLVIVANNDDTVTFVFWDGVDGAWSRRFDDWADRG